MRPFPWRITSAIWESLTAFCQRGVVRSATGPPIDIPPLPVSPWQVAQSSNQLPLPAAASPPLEEKDTTFFS